MGPDGTTVDVPAPGSIEETGILGARGSEEFHAREVADTPVGRTGTPADVADAVAYPVSPVCGDVSGQVIGVNGGAVLGR